MGLEVSNLAFFAPYIKFSTKYHALSTSHNNRLSSVYVVRNYNTLFAKSFSWPTSFFKLSTKIYSFKQLYT